MFYIIDDVSLSKIEQGTNSSVFLLVSRLCFYLTSHDFLFLVDFLRLKSTLDFIYHFWI